MLLTAIIAGTEQKAVASLIINSLPWNFSKAWRYWHKVQVQRSVLKTKKTKSDSLVA